MTNATARAAAATCLEMAASARWHLWMSGTRDGFDRIYRIGLVRSLIAEARLNRLSFAPLP